MVCLLKIIGVIIVQTRFPTVMSAIQYFVLNATQDTTMMLIKILVFNVKLMAVKFVNLNKCVYNAKMAFI